VLTFAQLSELHDLPVGELQRVVMHVGLLQVDLPEPSHLLPDEFPIKNILALHFPLECDLRTGKKAYCYR
jgi:hypothetical protein